MRTTIFASICLFALIVTGCSEEQRTPSVTSIVDVSWRSSLLLSNTGVLRITNRSSQPTPTIRIRYRNQDTGNSTSYTVGSINGNATAEVGILESGWMIEPNEIITVTATGYRSQNYYFYEDTNGEMIMTRGYAAKKTQQVFERVHNVFK